MQRWTCENLSMTYLHGTSLQWHAMNANDLRDTGASGLYVLDRALTREQLVAALAATPGRVSALLEHVDGDALTRRTDDRDWSPLEVCRHIRDITQVYGMRFKWIVLQDDALLANYDEDRWVASSPDGPSDIAALLDEMRAYRGETVRLLRSLTEDGWSRQGRHEVLGPVTLEPYVRHQVAHEEQHLGQLQQALA
jgi:hypothetical protein